jgi:glutaredoxin 3
MAKTVEIYTSPLCGFCHRAKRLLDARGIPYVEYDVLMDRDRKQEMLARAEGRHTVPQIFIDGEGIGGSDKLVEMDREGRLDELRAA